MYSLDKELFRKALSEAMINKFEIELKQCPTHVTCSAEHYEKISSIIGVDVTKQQRSWNTKKRSLIAILIAAAILLTGCTVYVYRNEIREFIEDVYENFIGVTFDEDRIGEGATITEQYIVSYVPEGYELINEVSNPLFVLYEWTNKDGETLSFEQMLLDGSGFWLDNEEGSKKIVEHGGYEIYYKQSDLSHHYIWNDGKYAMTLNSSVQLSDDDLIKILNSVKNK